MSGITASADSGTFASKTVKERTVCAAAAWNIPVFSGYADRFASVGCGGKCISWRALRAVIRSCAS